MAAAVELSPKNYCLQSLAHSNLDHLKYFIRDLLGKIYEFFDEQYLTDVTFKVSNPTVLVSAHRLILSAASSYFRDLFNSAKGVTPQIEITEVDSDVFENLIVYCYTGKITISLENIDTVIKAAMMLKLDKAVIKCIDYMMEHMSEYTLDRGYALCREMPNSALIRQKLEEYELKNFLELSQSPPFLNLTAEKLKTIVESSSLKVSCEEDVFGAIKRWYEHDVSTRQENLPELIECLRLSQFDTDFLMKQIKPLPGCELLAYKTISWINIPSLRAELILRFPKPRKGLCESWDGIELIAIHVGPTGSESIPGTIFQYSRTEDEWHKYHDIKMDLTCFSTVLKYETLFFIGGIENKQESNQVFSFNLRTKDTSESRLNLARYDCSVALCDDKIFVVGGVTTEEKYLSSVEIFPIRGSWCTICGIRISRCRAGAVTFNNKLYIIGGYNGCDLKSVECYDPRDRMWTMCADMTEGHDLPGVAEHDGKIYVLGGWSDTSQKVVERYDPEKNEWSKVCALTTGGWGIGCISIANHLWAVGGFCSAEASKNKNSVSVYDAEYDEWFDKKPVPKLGAYTCFKVNPALLQSP